MSKKQKPKNAKTDKTPDSKEEYVVGYGNPPKEHQFPPGHSGNLKGKPTGTRNFKTDVKSTLNVPVDVTKNGKRRKVSTQEATLLRLREMALKGDPRALEKLLSLAQFYNNEELATSSTLSSNDATLLEIYNDRLLNGAAGRKSDTSDQLSGNQPNSDPIDPTYDHIEEAWKLSGIDDELSSHKGEDV